MFLPPPLCTESGVLARRFLSLVGDVLALVEKCDTHAFKGVVQVGALATSPARCTRFLVMPAISSSVPGTFSAQA